MLRRDLAPLDSYLADAMTMEEDEFLARHPWPVLVTPEPRPDLIRKLRRPETVIRESPPLPRIDPSTPGLAGASLDALCLMVRPLDADTARIRIGRAPVADVVLIEESVSRIHAELVWDPEQERAWITDVETKNGTFLDDLRLEPRAEAKLVPGCLIRFGALLTRYYSPRAFRAWLTEGAPRSGASPGEWPAG